MCEAGRLDGFWLLVTNHSTNTSGEFEFSAEDLINPYRDKVIIESSFRDIKSFLDISPIFVWTELHVKAHYSCCVLGHLTNRTITNRLHDNKGEATSEIVSHERFYKKLSGCKIDRMEIKNTGLSSYNMTMPTASQKELLKRVGLTRLLSFEVVKKIRSAIAKLNYV